ncbi:MAG: hypothetical protein GQ564_09785 [Bacteroidales bacterium]|nr:hypothetical protein [Bacteroidales bacterium]
MKKILFTLLISIVTTNLVLSQSEVKDTLLLAFDNDIFWSSSSELEMDIYKDFGKYGSTNLSDSDPTTCWAEGADNDGTNEYIWMTISENISTIRIRNGYQKNETIYHANNRPKNLEFELFASYEPSGYVTESHNGFCISESLTSRSVVLEDKLGYQDIQLGFDWSEIRDQLSNDKTFDKDRFILKIKILDVYKGNKWNDACISDINIVPSTYFDLTIDEHGLLNVSANNTDTLFYNTEYIYQVVELSPNSKWIIFTLVPSYIETSRVETVYALYNTEKKQFIATDDVTILFGFKKESGKLYLDGSTKDLEDKSILLEDL